MVFVIMVLLSVAGILCAETPFNAPYKWAFKWLTLPICLTIVLFVYYEIEFIYRRVKGMIRVYFYTLVMMPVAVLLSGGLVNLVNACAPNPQRVIMEGPIIRKFETRNKGGGRSFHLEIMDTNSGKEMGFTIPIEEHTRLSIQDIYRREMKMGLLGIPFEPRWH